MTQDTCIGLFLLRALIAALPANDPDTFNDGINERGDPAATEMLLDWFQPFITEGERDRVMRWHLVVSL